MNIMRTNIYMLLLTLTVCFFTACHKDIWAELENLDQRVTKLEELCKEMNTNITSLQTIVDVLQANDYITGIVEIKKNGEVIGYTITFGKHEPITIYHGQDGKDGQNGADGKDGSTPVIGVAQDTDGVYYWTLNGEWLLDDNGNKLPVSGKDGQNGTNGSNGQDGADGKDGQDGEDGKDGADGKNGKDGITPQLKIEDGYWYISYDNGATWTQLGKATGEDGEKGDKGDTGDSMFQSVAQDENYVYFTLADGTVIKIAKENDSNDQPNSEFIFTITYEPNGGMGSMNVDTFYYGKIDTLSICSFAMDGYYCNGWNTKPDGSGAFYEQSTTLSINKNIVLYAQWKRKFYYFSASNSSKVIFSSGNLQYIHSTSTWLFAENQWDMIGENNVNNGELNDRVDVFEKCIDGSTIVVEGETSNIWRALTYLEWDYLLNQRNEANNLVGVAQINGINGLVILPDNWEQSILVPFKSGFSSTDSYSEYQIFTREEWSVLEFCGAVFLPAGGKLNNVTMTTSSVNESGCYLYPQQDGTSGYITFTSQSVNTGLGIKPRPGSSSSNSMRLVKNIK